MKTRNTHAVAAAVLLFSLLGAGDGRADVLYVANQNNNTIEKYTAGGVNSPFASTGNGPFGVAFDGAGNLYVAQCHL